MNLAKRKDAAAVSRIRAAATDIGVPVMQLSKHAMNALSDNRPHQGVLLDCGALTAVPMDVLPTAAELAAAAPEAPPPVWLVLDEVSDPVRGFSCVVAASFVHALVARPISHGSNTWCSCQSEWAPGAARWIICARRA